MDSQALRRLFFLSIESNRHHESLYLTTFCTINAGIRKAIEHGNSECIL